MEPSLGSPYRHRKSRSSDRFLDLFSGPASVGPAVELDEHDVFWTDRGDFPDPPPRRVPDPPMNGHNAGSGVAGFRRPENFGILAALPETLANHHRPFIHRSVSFSPSPTPSSSRMIPAIPKPQSPAVNFNQSAPVNVPVIPMSVGISRRKSFAAFEAAGDGGDEDDGEMLPPHEIVARSSARSLMTTFSVLEGKGRTLKGRDLRRVRNAVFQKTGFLD